MTERNFKVLIAALVLLIVAAIIAWIFWPSDQEIEYEIPEEVEEVIETKFGIPVDDYDIYLDTVKTGQTLGGILNSYGINAWQIDKISKMSTDSFNVTRINVGRPYYVFSDTIVDSIPKAKYFVYENGTVVYTMYDFSLADTIIIEKYRKKVDTIPRTASGVIESSLWNAIMKEGLRWELAIAMSQTFAWTVDFYALQKQDAFKVIYDEHFVEGESIGIGEIKAGVFYHHGKEFWAIPFEQDSMKSFFDTLGNNTRKTFMKAPLKYTRVSSRYSHARMHPIHKRPRAHLAVDFSAPTGTPVYAASDGVIVTRTFGTGAGYYVKIRHNSVYSTVYMHFSRFGDYYVGDYVQQGDIIGYVGSTGWSTGPHLHYEIHENGQKIDPLTFEPPPAEPVDSANMDRFNEEKRYWIDQIHEIHLDFYEENQ